MSSGLNRAIIIGNLGQDPELKFTQGGTPLLNMRVAATESYVNKNKERQERTEWLSVVVWGKRAEGLNKCLSKGSKVCVEGRIQTRSWEAQDGSKRYSTEINATNVVLLGGGSGGQKQGGGRDERDDTASQDDYGDDSIPF